MLVQRFIIEVFDSRNTSTEHNVEVSKALALSIAKDTSKKNKFPVIIRKGNDFIKFEQGKRTEQSLTF